MKRSLVLSIACVAAMCGIAGFFCGCETGSDTDFLTVSPSSASTTNKSEVVTFTVSGGTNETAESGLKDLSLPLKWTVSNSQLGYISGSSGHSASYIRNKGNGIQTIYVVDQYGAEGHATIDQQ